jgi:hypothetical protein
MKLWEIGILKTEKMSQTSVGVWEVAVDLKKQKEFVQYKYNFRRKLGKNYCNRIRR